MEEFIRLEPRLKEWFGIDRNNPYLQELFGNYASIKLNESSDKEKYINEKGHYDVNAYAEAHFEALAKEKMPMRISTDIYLCTIEDFCEENQLGITEKDEVYQVLLYAYALLMRSRLETTEAALEDTNYEYQEYIHAVRPDMLKLYIGLHHNDSQNDKVKKYYKQCRISFGDLSPIKIDEQAPWFQVALDRYLEKYLGVKSVKEAEQELNVVYGKTRQGRIIADLLNRLNLIEYKEKESFLDYMDGERIRVSLKSYLMQYDSIDEIIKSQQYRVSPNNTDSSRYY